MSKIEYFDTLEFYICMFQYYFGDINLAKDKFLQEEIKKDDGCILCLYSSYRPFFIRPLQN